MFNRHLKLSISETESLIQFSFSLKPVPPLVFTTSVNGSTFHPVVTIQTSAWSTLFLYPTFSPPVNSVNSAFRLYPQSKQLTPYHCHLMQSFIVFCLEYCLLTGLPSLPTTAPPKQQWAFENISQITSFLCTKPTNPSLSYSKKPNQPSNQSFYFGLHGTMAGL